MSGLVQSLLHGIMKHEKLPASSTFASVERYGGVMISVTH